MAPQEVVDEKTDMVPQEVVHEKIAKTPLVVEGGACFVKSQGYGMDSGEVLKKDRRQESALASVPTFPQLVLKMVAQEVVNEKIVEGPGGECVLGTICGVCSAPGAKASYAST